MANDEDTVMSDHNSDNNEDAASDRSASPEQNESPPDTSLPAYNPSNIPKDAIISDSRLAQKPKKKPKVAAKAPEDDYAELQKQPNIDSRADGGFINPDNAKPRDRRMKWTAEADRRLMIFGFGREIRSNEYPIIADLYKEKPTTKAIMERITKLRVETRRALKETGIFDPDRVVMPPTSSNPPPRGPATPRKGMSSPAAPASAKKPAPGKKVTPAKKATPVKKGRLASTRSSPVLPPRTGTPASRPQPPQQMGQQGLPSAQPPSTLPHPPPSGGARPPPGASIASMFPRPTGASQASNSQMGTPPTRARSSSQYPGMYGAITPGWLPGSTGTGAHKYYPSQQQIPRFEPGVFTPRLPSQQPTGAAANPPVTSSGASAEGEQEDPMARTERELKEKRAKRDARKKSFQPPK